MRRVLTTCQRSAFAFVLAAATSHALAQGAPPAPPVQVSAPLAKKITLWDEYTGRFEAREQVEVRARVSGFIEKVHFRDGQVVNKGDLLFSIDQRPFQLSVDAARADVERAKAQVALAENEVERAEGLTRNQTITARDLDQRKANLASARASQQAAEANLKQAELNLEWTEVRAPIGGRISDKRVDAGNLITGAQGGATLLTNIISVDPINFIFEASEADYLRYSRLLQSGDRPSGREKPLPVRVRLADEADWKREGRMEFVDNQLNARSGTIRGRAIFANQDQFLTAGTFGRLQLYAGELDALMIPDAAIVSDQTSKLVFIIGPENKVVPKPVVPGPIVDGLRVIRSGLAANDRVIINGLANPMVRPGVPVTPQPGEIKPPARP
ncbi:efflux RND transporter periplasmic adaptor subunit [Rhabdaerophilum sp. SD176]|uniref:efflux RND transporter periplasmic adaptor subunit n=1 Tax=Rhabdaerophilum sp. SD176 TaxID=2983548 RepID=UPI0024DFD177|nr:efflux RND transporter periplasmic adaptor subunit [Rhabdaerophilum sp. SD176]